ncbi:hypothetical protein Q5P01_024282 [Channa striata]|uniref:GDNF/GAS1 domain-containing protein n=1 Tax=Channa striata TaxID=64152 RepID=A0AA88IQ31_CHASR|nr:hypothetical protein Q5P01_024282 [Channa striata]
MRANYTRTDATTKRPNQDIRCHVLKTAPTALMDESVDSLDLQTPPGTVPHPAQRTLYFLNKDKRKNAHALHVTLLGGSFFVDMAGRATVTERTAVLVSRVFILIVGVCVGSPNHSRRPVCWKAVLQCHGEPDCRYAYEQYLGACASVLGGERKKCPSHCISSLIQLNRTQSGPALEDCDCASDPVCRAAKQAIEPCLPRTRIMGCTEARRQCDTEPSCSSAMRDYLFHCRKLFGGQRCSDGCRRVIASLRSIPKAQQLDTCVCDGAERNICEYIKVSMERFCSESGDRFAGSGFSDSEEDSEDDYMDQDEDQYGENSSGSVSCHTALRALSTTLVFMKFI